jgi:plastocyanin
MHRDTPIPWYSTVTPIHRSELLRTFRLHVYLKRFARTSNKNLYITTPCLGCSRGLQFASIPCRHTLAMLLGNMKILLVLVAASAFASAFASDAQTAAAASSNESSTPSVTSTALETSATSSATMTVSATGSVTSTNSTSNGPKTHLVKAGAGGFHFEPQQLENVAVGDLVTFEFYPPDHSVARAEYGSACVPYEYTGKGKTGFWSSTQWVDTLDDVGTHLAIK